MARFCVVDEKLATPYVILFEDGEGIWLDGRLRGRARFALSLDNAVFRNDGRTVSRIVDELICEPDADISFARRWATLARDERQLLLLRGEKNQCQIESVMLWALTCENGLWEYGERWAWLLAYPRESDSSHLTDPTEDDGFDMNEVGEKFPLVFRLHNFLVKHYLPDLCAPLKEQHRCVLDLEVDNTGLTIMTGLSGQPSAHEQMEARLQLRDWLQRNAYPEEIEAIGPF